MTEHQTVEWKESWRDDRETSPPNPSPLRGEGRRSYLLTPRHVVERGRGEVLFRGSSRYVQSMPPGHCRGVLSHRHDRGLGSRHREDRGGMPSSERARPAVLDRGRGHLDRIPLCHKLSTSAITMSTAY